jgi:catechol 2,3-dioxygenase-like lactoylglutathione lyase family enzyme
MLEAVSYHRTGGVKPSGLFSWEPLIGEELVTGNSSELFFEENDIDSFWHKLEKYQTDAGEEPALIGKRENSWGKHAVMFRDPDGHLIEVAEK